MTLNSCSVVVSIPKNTILISFKNCVSEAHMKIFWELKKFAFLTNSLVNTLRNLSLKESKSFFCFFSGALEFKLRIKHSVFWSNQSNCILVTVYPCSQTHSLFHLLFCTLSIITILFPLDLFQA